MDTCPLCTESLENGQVITKLGEKGCEGVNKASKERQDSLNLQPGQYVHKTCRQSYTNAKSIFYRKRKLETQSESSSTKRVLRSENMFNFKEVCLFCGKSTKLGDQSMKNVYYVRTFDFQEKVLEDCATRQDTWSDIVFARIQCVQDLHAADAVYHQMCSVNFRTKRGIPKQFKSEEVEPNRAGRPSIDKTDVAFLRVAQFLEENDDEQISINDLTLKMKEFLEGTTYEPYSFKHMKQKLLSHFGEKIIISNSCGKKNIVTLTSTASSILEQFYKMPKQENTAAEKLRIIETAAKLLKNDIKSIDIDKTMYPEFENIESDIDNYAYLPSTLRCLLEDVFAGKDTLFKVASIGQAIIQSCRPRSIVAPLQIGLGVQMHRQFGSRFLIDALYKHGYCSSYSEVCMYERSAVVHQGTEITGYKPEMFIQHVADNVDHNIRTIDGLGTFHGMGIVTTVTPGNNATKPIPRVTVSSDDVMAVGKINIAYFKPRENFKSLLKFKKLTLYQTDDKTFNVDLFWKISWLLKPHRPSWNGFMQTVQHGNYPGKSTVLFMPMIDMKSSDENCIYSTLCFVSEQARRYKSTPVLTFDQPLWWKASEILEHEAEGSVLRNIVLRMGGLHVEMSFL